MALDQGSSCSCCTFPFNIYTMAETSDFKFGTQLGFAKAHHKIKPIGNSGHGFGLGELPKILQFHVNIYTMWAWPWVRDAPVYLGFPFLQGPRWPLSVSGASCCFTIGAVVWTVETKVQIKLNIFYHFCRVSIPVCKYKYKSIINTGILFENKWHIFLTHGLYFQLQAMT